MSRTIITFIMLLLKYVYKNIEMEISSAFVSICFFQLKLLKAKAQTVSVALAMPAILLKWEFFFVWMKLITSYFSMRKHHIAICHHDFRFINWICFVVVLLATTIYPSMWRLSYRLFVAAAAVVAVVCVFFYEWYFVRWQIDLYFNTLVRRKLLANIVYPLVLNCIQLNWQ